MEKTCNSYGERFRVTLNSGRPFPVGQICTCKATRNIHRSVTLSNSTVITLDFEKGWLNFKISQDF